MAQEFRAVMHDEATAKRTGWAGKFEADTPERKKALESPAGQAKAAKALAATVGLPASKKNTSKIVEHAKDLKTAGRSMADSPDNASNRAANTASAVAFGKGKK